MVKSDLVEMIWMENSSLTKAEVRKLVEVVFEEIAQALEQGKRVELRGFGVFRRKFHKGRIRNIPQLGGAVEFEGRHVTKFRPSSALTSRMNRETE